MAARAAELGVKASARRRPLGANPAFETTPEAYARTTDIVPQSTAEEAMARVPRLGPGDSKYPNNGRMLPLMDLREGIAEQLADDIRPHLGSNTQNFYNTGPVYEGLDRVGINPEDFMRNSLAPTYAGTSPRTNTLQNLRNASMIEYLRGQGVPIDEHTYDTLGNVKGYPMMASHYALTDRLLRGANDINRNPKPTEFMGNVAGDLAGVTGDVHNIRGILYALNKKYPGAVPLDFLDPSARARYLETQQFNPASDVLDALGSATRNRAKSQVEYGPLTDINQSAAEKLGIPGAHEQALQWFQYGDKTGLGSEPKTIADLLNDRLDVTGQVLGEDPQQVLRRYANPNLEMRVPIMAKGGPVDTDRLREKYSV